MKITFPKPSLKSYVFAISFLGSTLSSSAQHVSKEFNYVEDATSYFSNFIVEYYSSRNLKPSFNKNFILYTLPVLYDEDTLKLTFIDKKPFNFFGKGDILKFEGKNIDVVDYNLDGDFSSASEKFKLSSYEYNKSESDLSKKVQEDLEVGFRYIKFLSSSQFLK